jgi:ankyrin repeat protein
MKKGMMQTGLIAALCLFVTNLFAAEETPLYETVKSGNIAEVQRLLDSGANVNAQNKMLKNTPLHGAAAGGKTDVAALLLDRGADIEARTVLGVTPLHDAANAGYAATVALLLDRGANIEARTQMGDTPLHGAAVGDHREVVTLLLDRGADVHAKNNKSRTPIDEASFFRNTAMVSLLQSPRTKKPVAAATPVRMVVSKEDLQTAKRNAAEKLSRMDINELLSEQPLDSEGAVLALSDALLESKLEKLPTYLLRNPGSEAKLLVEVEKRLRDAQMQISKCNNDAEFAMSKGNEAEAKRLRDLAVAIQGYQASLLSIKSELEKY